MSKDIGVERNIDDLGRIVIPKDIRERLGIVQKDKVEFKVEGKKIIINKVMR